MALSRHPVIVYRNQGAPALAARTLASLGRTIEALGAAPAHDALVEVLIRLGALESAVADARHPDRDDDDALARSFRDASRAAGHLVRLSWSGRGDRLGAWKSALTATLASIRPAELPPRIELQVPEGYAQYGLYPETYLEAAARCFERFRPERVVCIGLRSIGTSLSAVVTAMMESRGCRVVSCTLRPRGHPFDRRIAMTERLEAVLRAAGASLCLVVDEGPGISGSSLASAAEAMNRLGLADDRIVLLPSWSTDGRGLRSDAARARWARHPQFTAGFEEVWVDSGRLLPDAVTAPRDLSAGAWRELFLPASAHRTPTHPQHERRKLLADSRLLSFAGLAGLARQRLARAHALGEAGFTPAPQGETHGFLVRDVVPGAPLAGGGTEPELLDTMARYLAHLRLHFQRQPAAGDELQQMIATNVSESLGARGERLLAAHRRRWGPAADEAPAALDGRMLPHEWLRTASGHLKVDALDHHDDHFFPGCRDIAWDVAGTCVEFDLHGPSRRYFVERYRRESGDRTIADRLPPFTVAYLAFRTGYAAMAAETLAGTPDGTLFGRLATRYRSWLQQELAHV